jgi:outer membrane protein assembly factor BamB
LLIGRSITDGKILLKLVAKEGERLYAGAEAQLFSLIDDDRRFAVICRDAATGEICWERKIKIRGEDKDTIRSQIEMKVSDGRLYLLTLGYMRAFDAANGKMLWEVPLYPEKSLEEESLWNRILSFFD